jgi:hypothetical protein
MKDLLKCKYIKWSCIFDLRLQAKNYDEKKNWVSNFQIALLPCGGEEDSIARQRKGIGKFDLQFFFLP